MQSAVGGQSGMGRQSLTQGQQETDLVFRAFRETLRIENSEFPLFRPIHHRSDRQNLSTPSTSRPPQRRLLIAPAHAACCSGRPAPGLPCCLRHAFTAPARINAAYLYTRTVMMQLGRCTDLMEPWLHTYNYKLNLDSLNG